ncbi:MAG: hypothetical protein RLZZ494_2096 [Pseudomonadota bacterium]|jgi:predicted porin
MKKALIPAALLLSLAGAAHAELALYGLIDLSYGKNGYVGDQKADFHSGGDDGSSQGNSTSRFGLKGSTDIGSGLKANFRLESNGITSDGDIGSPFFGRQAWAGVSGGFGEVRLGRQDSVAFQTMIGFDANGAANAASAFVAAGVAPYNPGRQSRSLQYISPDFSGLKVQAGFKPAGDEDGTTNGKDVLSLGVTYTLGGLTVAATGESARTDGTEGFGALAASYDFGVAKVMVSGTNGGDVNKGGIGNGFGVGVSAPIAGFTVGVNYGKNTTTETKAAELFINREVLKNTIVYLDLGRAKYADDTSRTAYALGVIYTF